MPEQAPTPDPVQEAELAIQAICRDDPRYAPAAYRFVMFEGIEYTTRKHLKLTDQTVRHLTGREVCEGLRALALEQFGYLAWPVWRSWGIRTSRDWGEIVFNLCARDLLSRTDEDRIEDFDDIYDPPTALRAGSPLCPPTA